MPHLALLACGSLGVLVVTCWLVSQVRLTRRRRWANEAATALRLGDAQAIQGLLDRIPPWASGLDEVLLEARERIARTEVRVLELAAELREAQRAFQEAPLALFLLDGRARIELANRRALVLFERTSRELVGRSLADFGLLREARERGRAGRPAMLELDRPGGAISIQLWDAAPRSDERRVVAALEVSAIDRQRSEPISDLEAVGRFAGSVAHDFNDLLTAVLGRASVMISESDPASPLHRDLSEIMTAGEQARLLTHQLMALSRQTVIGRSPPGPTPASARPADPTVFLRPPEPAPAATPSATICVVEDDEAVRRFVTTVLERDGHRVIEAADSEQCLERCRAHEGPIDLLVSDVHMPAMYGPEIYLDLLRERPDLGALFMSGYVERDLFLADQGRSYEFLQKPFTALELVTSVRAALHRHRRGPPARVLYVGDDPGVRAELGAHLRSLGVEARFAEDGERALELLESERVDALLCEMVRHAGDGVQVCSELLRRHPEVRLVALATRPRGTNALAVARGLGAVAELLVPFSKDELAIALEKALTTDPASRRTAQPRPADAA